ncbi:DUF5677 domain-containing protein [Chloroflexota bacterium]
METEFKKLLNRKKHIEDTGKHFSKRLEVLRDMVNYGSWLIPRAYDSSKKGYEELITIGVLLKQIVMMIDAIDVLASNAITVPGFLQSRAAFEASLYIEWILKEDSEKRAKHYYVSNLRKNRLWALRLIEGTEQQIQFSDDTKKLAPHVNFFEQGIKDEAERQVKDINRILSQDSLKRINDELENLYRRRKIEPNWYAPIAEKNSLKWIASNVYRIPEYLFFYNLGSEVVHSSSYYHHIEISKGNNIKFKPIRNLSTMTNLLQNSMGTAIHTYRIIIERYRPGEMVNYIRKYNSDWRKYYLNIPSSIEYHSIEEGK